MRRRKSAGRRRHGNNRIQIFDLTGTFVRQWDVPEWGHDAKQFGDVAYDTVTKRLYVSSGKTNEILAYDIEGKPQPGIKPPADNRLDLPGSLTISDVDNKRRLLVVNTGGAKLSAFDLEPAKKEPDKKEPEKKSPRRDLRSGRVDLYLKLVVGDVDLRPAAREQVRLFQDHREAAVRDIYPILASGKDRRCLRIEPLRNAVADRSRSRRRKAVVRRD
jgi:hypothetical protein